MRPRILAAAYLLDCLAGDPEWFPHPVRLIGLATTRGETLLRHPNQSNAAELVLGAALTTTVVAATYYVTAETIRLANRYSEASGYFVEALFGWTCLAAHNLQQEATAVTDALASGDILLGRRLLARIVGRDTQHLDIHEISRAAIETVAESACDGILAPLFYMALGGVPLALAYKAVNTLDSMIGHADARYLYFGKFAARLDDLANYLPARMTAAGIVAASCLVRKVNAQSAWQTWRRDGAKHKSPNAGQPESAMAGAVCVRLGGNNIYAGEVIPARFIGEEFPAPTIGHARQAIRLVSVVGLLGVGIGMLLTTLSTIGRPK